MLSPVVICTLRSDFSEELIWLFYYISGRWYFG